MVAEHVMGWKRGPDKSAWWVDATGFQVAGWNVWSPPTSISDAMLVVTKLRSEGLWCDMVSVQTIPDVGRWSAMFYNREEDHEATSHTLEDAICLCSIRARKIQIEE